MQLITLLHPVAVSVLGTWGRRVPAEHGPLCAKLLETHPEKNKTKTKTFLFEVLLDGLLER